MPKMTPISATLAIGSEHNRRKGDRVAAKRSRDPLVEQRFLVFDQLVDHRHDGVARSTLAVNSVCRTSAPAFRSIGVSDAANAALSCRDQRRQPFDPLVRTASSAIRPLSRCS